MKGLKKMLDIISTFIFVIGFCCILCYLVTGITTGKANICSYRLFHIMSESMEPVINTDDFVLAKVITDEDIKEQNIVAYKKGNKTIIHRIITIDGDTIITKGDNNQDIDEPITKDMIQYLIFYNFTTKQNYVPVQS